MLVSVRLITDFIKTMDAICSDMLRVPIMQQHQNSVIRWHIFIEFLYLIFCKNKPISILVCSLLETLTRLSTNGKALLHIAYFEGIQSGLSVKKAVPNKHECL